MTVYLLHFDRPYKHAAHYIGFTDTDDVDGRIEAHRNGTGARLMQVIRDAGIGFTVARIWCGESRRFERRLKRCKKPFHFCPCCNPRSATQNMKGDK